MIVDIHDAKSQLARLIERAAAGEEIILGKAGRPMAKLVPYRDGRTPRRPGALKGKVRLADDFDATPDEVIDAFESGTFLVLLAVLAQAAVTLGIAMAKRAALRATDR